MSLLPVNRTTQDQNFQRRGPEDTNLQATQSIPPPIPARNTSSAASAAKEPFGATKPPGPAAPQQRTRTPAALPENEIEYGFEGLAAMSPKPSQNNFQPTSFSTPVPSGGFGPAAGVRSGLVDQQTKNSVFSNALSSSVHHNLQQYHLAQDVLSLGIDPMSNVNAQISNSMDMH